MAGFDCEVDVFANKPAGEIGADAERGVCLNVVSARLDAQTRSRILWEPYHPGWKCDQLRVCWLCMKGA